MSWKDDRASHHRNRDSASVLRHGKVCVLVILCWKCGIVVAYFWASSDLIYLPSSKCLKIFRRPEVRQGRVPKKTLQMLETVSVLRYLPTIYTIQVLL